MINRTYCLFFFVLSLMPIKVFSQSKNEKMFTLTTGPAWILANFDDNFGISKKHDQKMKSGINTTFDITYNLKGIFYIGLSLEYFSSSATDNGIYEKFSLINPKLIFEFNKREEKKNRLLF